ncbi:MAG: hypothetical protein QE570_02255 [Verrucomicrobiota bacterium]|jgi:hypothetical protein|nr:hypothetical protein [Verrucomicrobiota bacterium]
MPINNFSGSTFVAFADIAGFQKRMNKPNSAMEALHHFYSHGYNIIRSQQQDAPERVEGLFISDCAVLFVRHDHANIRAQLRAILSVVQSINRELLQHDLMLFTAIAHGRFDYSQRQEFTGIEKNLILGEPYLEAYIDQSSGSPKLNPGQCRILHKNIPQDMLPLSSDDEYFHRIRHGCDRSYFYWMCETSHEIESFDRLYRDAGRLKGDKKYEGMLKALKRNI